MIEDIKNSILCENEDYLFYNNLLNNLKENLTKEDLINALDELEKENKIYKLIKTQSKLTYIKADSQYIKKMVYSGVKGSNYIFKEIEKENQEIIELDSKSVPRDLMYLDTCLIVIGEISKVIKIISRNTKTLYGKVKISKTDGGHFIFFPISQNNLNIYTFVDDNVKLNDNDKVIVQIESYEKFKVSLIRVLSSFENSRYSDVLSVLYENGFTDFFDKKVLEEANKINKEIDIKLTKNRKDYRSLLTMTIDGDDSKDFDDAISLEKTNKGYIIYVHIADVSEYVKEGSLLDKEARKRTCSIYFPENVFPMIPEVLSNGDCSLNPNEDRYSLTAEIEIDKRGNIIDGSIHEGIIKSDYRMTYNDIQKILDGDKILQKKYTEIKDRIFLFEKVSDILKKKRENLGVINFSTKEFKFKIENDKVLEILKCEYLKSNEIIENFMILANEFVSMFMTKRKTPFIYRVHKEPDMEKLFQSIQAAKELNFNIDINEFQSSFNEEIKKEKDENISQIVSYMFLRSMSKAKYSTLCEGHYGLGLKYYSHFTSPIRRYPDLMIHRIIKEYLKKSYLTNQEILHFKEETKEVAKHSTEKEILSLKAEREIQDFYKCQYLKDSNKLKDKYMGRIISVTKFGLFVEFDNGIEGLIKFTSLIPSDYYFIKGLKLIGEKYKKEYKLGDKIEVRIKDIDYLNKKISLTMQGEKNARKSRR